MAANRHRFGDLEKQRLLLHDLIIIGICILLVIAAPTRSSSTESVPFWNHYMVEWGETHVHVSQDGSTVDLVMDQSSGAGIRSKLTYASGFFHINVKLPATDTYGVLPTFYLIAPVDPNTHDELDFEFIGSESTPFVLSTNIFIHGVGGREQKVELWFDPRSDYHAYSILWNAHITVFYVDGIPIRVLKNATRAGTGYPTEPMQVMATNWFAEWTLGGRQMNWNQAPFTASYQGFQVDACPDIVENPDYCSSPRFWWNKNKYWQLDPEAELKYMQIREKYLVYDYCTDKSRYHVPPPECVI